MVSVINDRGAVRDHRAKINQITRGLPIMPETRTDYVIFWADGHSPVRILPKRHHSDRLRLGSYDATLLNGYARYLRSLFSPCDITWELTNDCLGSYPELLAKDLAEYKEWAESESVSP
jgi:hypothetical protein